MKSPRLNGSRSFIGALGIALCGFVNSISAAVIISPGDSLGVGAVKDGGFESGLTGIPWTANTTNTYLNIKNDNTLAYEGSFSLQIIKENAAPYWSTAAMNTGYSIASGDQLSFSFYAKKTSASGDGKNVTWNLFYTSDNTLTGTRTNIVSMLGGTAGVVSPTYTLNSFTMSSAVDAGAVGKTLFVSFLSDPLTAGAVNAVEIDNVSLSTVPEPSTCGLFLLGLIALTVAKRRHRFVTPQ